MKFDLDDSYGQQQRIGTIAGAVLNAGGFYICSRVGGFQDVKSGLFFPGPKAVVDSVTRQITELVDLPSPVQLPTHRYAEFNSLSPSDQRAIDREKVRLLNEPDLVLCRFDAYTNNDFLGGLLLALRTETIREVTNDDMKLTFPEVWALRKDKIIPGKSAKDTMISDSVRMFAALMNNRRTSLRDEARTGSATADA